ncbi:MAG: FHA domain-containing protein [Pirellulales bacterium]
MAYLTAINGNAQGTRYDIERDIVILGRHPDCDIQLEVGAVSRQHARILRQGEVLKLEDMNSRNGTFVNGQAIKEATTLADGDLIRICDLEFSVHSDSGEQQLYDSGMMGAEGSSTFGVVLVDDQEDSESHAVMSKIDVRSGTGGSHLTTSAESRLAAVLEIVHSLGKALVVDEVLPKVLDTLFRIFVQADRGFIVLRENGQLVTKWTKMRQSESMQAVRISRTIMREVMENRQAIISLDASSDERFDMSQSVADVKIRSMIVAPLLNSEGEALGAIQMDTMNKRQQFAEADLEILAAVASQAGAAIENAQLHEALVEQKMLEQDLDLAQRVQQAFLPSKPPDLPASAFPPLQTGTANRR